jgi:transglutaminase-like putative cysteine protease
MKRLLKVLKEIFFRIIPVYTVAALVPVLFKYFLQSDFPLWVIFALVWPTLSINYLNSLLLTKLGKEHPVTRTLYFLSTFYFLGFALMLIAIINITPSSIFQYWLESPEHTFDAVIISNIFVMLACLFTALQCGAIFIHRSYKSLIILLSLALGLIIIIQPNVLYISLLALSLLLLIMVYIKKNLAIYVTLLLLATGAGGLLFSLAPPPHGSPLVDNFISPQLRILVNRLAPEYPLLLGLPGYGYSFNEEKLGGVPTLSSIMLFEVEGTIDKTFHLREEVFDYYSGTDWQKTVTPVHLQVQKDFTPPEGEAYLKLTLVKGPYFLLPHSLETTEIYFNRNRVQVPPQAVWDSQALVKEPLTGGSVIYLIASPVENRPKTELTREEQATFLQTPVSLPVTVRDLAKTLTTGLNTPTEKLSRIESYLAVNNVYNLNAANLETGEDFVEKFLFKDKRGYCVHFASAFTLLARLNNIPARYISGYLLNGVYEPDMTDIPEKRPITGYSSHAWAEVWLEEKGWVAWEATPAVNPAYYADEEGTGWLFDGAFSDNDLTQRQLANILGRRPAVKQQPPATTSETNILGTLVTLLPGLAVSLASLLAGTWCTLWLINRLREHFYPRQAALLLLRKLPKKYKAIPAPSQQGWLQWFASLQTLRPELSPKLETWQNLVLRTLYSDQTITLNEVKALKAISKELG